MDKQKTIDKSEIQAAMSKFLAEGRLIKKLPDQVVPRSSAVGNQWAMYESPSENSAAQ